MIGKPGPYFKWLWLAWSFLLGVCVFWTNPYARALLAVAFFAIELPGAMLEGRDPDRRRTLSRIVTYYHRKMSKPGERKVAARGWNALLFTPYVLCIAYVFYTSFAEHTHPVFAAVLTLLLSVGLWDHWYQTEKYGLRVSVANVVVLLVVFFAGVALAAERGPTSIVTVTDTVAAADFAERARRWRIRTDGLRARLEGIENRPPEVIVRTDTLVMPPDTVFEFVSVRDGRVTASVLIQTDSAGLRIPELHEGR